MHGMSSGIAYAVAAWIETLARHGWQWVEVASLECRIGRPSMPMPSHDQVSSLTWHEGSYGFEVRVRGGYAVTVSVCNAFGAHEGSCLLREKEGRLEVEMARGLLALPGFAQHMLMPITDEIARLSMTAWREREGVRVAVSDQELAKARSSQLVLDGIDLSRVAERD
jgi:hypothetical protein